MIQRRVVFACLDTIFDDPILYSLDKWLILNQDIPVVYKLHVLRCIMF